MDQSIFIASNAANNIFQAQAIHANNLANVTTLGFKADLAFFSGEEIEGGSLETRSNSSLSDAATDHNPGRLVQTGRDLDIAIDGEGFIVVQTLTGKEAYTRAGDLQFDAAGVLTTSRGMPVLGNGGPIVLPQSQSVEIGKDGTISVLPLGQAVNALAVLDRIKLVKPDLKDIQKGEDGLFHIKQGEKPDVDASVKLVSGALESSNVNAIYEMTEIISLARQFESQLKMMNSIEQIDTKSETLMSLSS